jgi:hypothetical protein
LQIADQRPSAAQPAWPRVPGLVTKASGLEFRKETMVTLGWIVERLKMGSVAYLNNRLYLLRQGKLK